MWCVLGMRGKYYNSCGYSYTSLDGRVDPRHEVSLPQTDRSDVLGGVSCRRGQESLGIILPLGVRLPSVSG